MLTVDVKGHLHDYSIAFALPSGLLDSRMGHYRVQSALFESIILGVNGIIGKAHQHFAYPAVIVVHERNVEDWVRAEHSWLFSRMTEVV